MAEAIEILKRQGAVIVDPAEIPSVVDPGTRYATCCCWNTCAGADEAKGKTSIARSSSEIRHEARFQPLACIAGAAAPVKTLPNCACGTWGIATAGAIKYGQSLLDISDEMDLDADRARYQSDRAKDIALAATHGIDEVMNAEHLGRSALSGTERRGHCSEARLSDRHRAVRHRAQRAHSAAPGRFQRPARSFRRQFDGQSVQRAALNPAAIRV